MLVILILMLILMLILARSGLIGRIQLAAPTSAPKSDKGGLVPP
jgi:hypothetical protein